MVITEIRVKLCDDNKDRLLAFCAITFDNTFLVRDLKIIDGVSGPFIAMPSRKLTDRCPKCSGKNHLRARFCNSCGLKLLDNRVACPLGRPKLYSDIAHPIHANGREQIQAAVVNAYRKEREDSRRPGYVSTYDLEFSEE